MKAEQTKTEVKTQQNNESQDKARDQAIKLSQIWERQRKTRQPKDNTRQDTNFNSHPLLILIRKKLKHII